MTSPREKKPHRSGGKVLPEVITHAPGEAADEKVVDLSAERATRLTVEKVGEERAKRIRAAVEDLNKGHALARIKGRSYILTEEEDEMGNPSYVLSGERDFTLYNRNRTILLPKAVKGMIEYERKQVAPLWLAAEDRRSITRVTFKPGGDTREDEYNLFKGWGVVPAADYDPANPTKGCELIVDLCNRLFGQGSERARAWAMAWLAQLVQEPESKPGTALVLRSQEGTGKGTLMNAVMRPILRAAYVHIAHRRHLTGNFNSIWQGSLLLFADEAVWAGDKEGQGVLNALITEDSITIEGKGKDAFSLPNLARLVFASNADWVVPAGPTARRFGVYDCNHDRMQDDAYFASVREQAANGGLEAFLAYLLHYDISGVNLRKPIVTDSLVAQKVATLRQDSVAHWWFERLYDGELAGAADALADGIWPREITRERMRASYEAYCKRMNVRHPASAEEIGRRITTEFGAGSARASKKGEDGSRPMLYTFRFPGEHEIEHDPDYARLAFFRATFERRMFDAVYDWPGQKDNACREVAYQEPPHPDTEIPF